MGGGGEVAQGLPPPVPLQIGFAGEPGICHQNLYISGNSCCFTLKPSSQIKLLKLFLSLKCHLTPMLHFPGKRWVSNEECIARGVVKSYCYKIIHFCFYFCHIFTSISIYNDNNITKYSQRYQMKGIDIYFYIDNFCQAVY